MTTIVDYNALTSLSQQVRATKKAPELQLRREGDALSCEDVAYSSDAARVMPSIARAASLFISLVTV